MEFRPYVYHIAGDANNLADWLSRSLSTDDEELPDYMFAPKGNYHLVHHNYEVFKLPTPLEMSTAAKEDELELPPNTIFWRDGIARFSRNKKIYIPQKFRQRVLLWFHGSKFGGHQGVTRTINRLKKFIGWPGLHKEVEEFICKCPVCNVIKPLPKGGRGIKGALDRAELFLTVSLDFMGPRKYDDKDVYILVIVDHYSRFMVTAAMFECPTTASIIENLHRYWFPSFGIPRVLLTDQGPQFRKEWTEYLRVQLGCRHALAGIEYPQGNGINESSHRILETGIKIIPKGQFNNYHELLSFATMVYNATPNSIIGDTPSSLMFGTSIKIPGLQDYDEDLDEKARLTILRNAKGSQFLLKQLAIIDDKLKKGRGKNLKTFEEGDLVTYRLSKTERSNEGRHWTGTDKYGAVRSLPHRVVKVNPNGMLTLQSVWTENNEREVPTSECKLTTRFVPNELRQQIEDLFPNFKWAEESEEEGSHPSSAKDSAIVIKESPVEISGGTEQSRYPTRKRARRGY